jgi:transcriptional regulator with XRE-family HTH domain
MFNEYIRQLDGIMSIEYMLTMTGTELRERIRRLGLTYKAAAEKLGMSLPGLNHQMRGLRRVTRQTELLLERIEAERSKAVPPRKHPP